ncbi:MAG: hypothetical protein NT036_04170, partial [Candidatus Omnitrophica bacterium]|nr:hypothetical protein [Candidatus Omnitrophota bacterium]
PGETNINNNNDSLATIEVIDPAAPPEPPAPPPEPAEGLVDLIGTRLYVADNAGLMAGQITVGQPITIVTAVTNLGTADATASSVRVTDNNGFACETPISPVPAGREVSIPPIPYTFNAQGPHTLRLEVNPLNDPRETNINNNNTCTFEVNVQPADNAGAVAGPLTFVKLAIKSTDTGQDYADDVCYVDKPVTIYAQIQNNNNAAVPDVVPVDIGMDSIKFGTVSCSFGPNQTQEPGFSKTFTHPGRFKIYANVDPLDSVGRREAHGKWITVKGATAAEAPLSLVSVGIRNPDTNMDYPNSNCLVNDNAAVYAIVENWNEAQVNDVPIELGIDGIKHEPVMTYSFWPNQKVYPSFNKTFTVPGTYEVYATIDPQNTQGRFDSKTRTIHVNSPLTEQVARSVYCDRVGFWSDVTGRIERTVYTGDTGYVFAEITNRANQIIPNLRRVLKFDRAFVKDTGDQARMPANSTIILKENNIHRRMNAVGRYLMECDIDPNDRKGQKSHTQDYIDVRPAGVHHVSGELKFYVTGFGDPTDTIGTNQTGRVNWIVRNQRWEEQRNVRVRVKVDGAQKEDKTVNLNRSPGVKDGWIENIKFDRIGSHSIMLLIDEDKTFPKTITALRPYVGAKIELYNYRGEPVRRATRHEAYKIKYTVVNNGKAAIENMPLMVKVDDVVRKDAPVSINPSPGLTIGYVENVVFDSPGQHKASLFMDSMLCTELPVTVDPGEPLGFFGELELYDSNGPTTTAAITGTYRIKYTAGFNMPNNNGSYQACLYVRDDDKRLASRGVQFDPPYPKSKEYWVEDVKFAGLGPHTLMLSIESLGGHYTKVITVTKNPLLRILDGRRELAPTSGPKIGHPSDSGPEKPKSEPPDARAVDIGFIPNGAKDYLDEIYQGEKGSIYAAFSNDSKADIKNLKVQILIAGKVIRQSVKPLVKAGATDSIQVDNYWFNTFGKHKLSLIVDPDNSIKESNEKNNNVGHTINVIPRAKPRTSSYDGASAAAVSDILGSLGKPKKPGTSSPPPYTPPTTYTPPRVTTTTVDQGGSSSGTTTQKKTPTFTVKGLGK